MSCVSRPWSNSWQPKSSKIYIKSNLLIRTTNWQLKWMKLTCFVKLGWFICVQGLHSYHCVWIFYFSFRCKHRKSAGMSAIPDLYYCRSKLYITQQWRRNLYLFALETFVYKKNLLLVGLLSICSLSISVPRNAPKICAEQLYL